MSTSMFTLAKVDNLVHYRMESNVVRVGIPLTLFVPGRIGGKTPGSLGKTPLKPSAFSRFEFCPTCPYDQVPVRRDMSADVMASTLSGRQGHKVSLAEWLSG